ncbi:MAG: RNA polymerase sigma factor [Planctomycetota bacterium]
MAQEEVDYEGVLEAVQRCLGRVPDALTREHADDLAQAALIETWRRAASLREPRAAPGFARTIARRLRYHMLIREGRLRQRMTRLDAARAVHDRRGEDASTLSRKAFAAHGRWLDYEWLTEQLDEVLAGLGPINEQLLRAHCEGQTCRELAAVSELGAVGVKARLHRSRKRVERTYLERAVCADRDQAPGWSRRHDSRERLED